MRTRTLRTSRLAVVAALAMVMALLGPIPASASFPGENGRIAAAIGSSCVNSDMRIYTMEPDGSDVRILTSTTGGRHPEWSPDGRKIAYHDGTENIYIVDHDGSNRRWITQGRWPSWSPDGTRLVYERPVGSVSDLWTIDLATRVTTRLTTLEEDYTSDPQIFADWHRNPEWSPVSDVIVFERTYTTREQGPGGDSFNWSGLWTVNADGSGMSPLFEYNQDDEFWGLYHEPEWAPDGGEIAVYLALPGRTTVATVSSGGGAPAILAEYPYVIQTAPAYAPDGSVLAYNWRRQVEGEPARDVVVVGDTDVYSTTLDICGLDWQRVPDWRQELVAVAWAHDGAPGYELVEEAAVGDEFTVTVGALNTGEIDLDDVMPVEPPTVTGSGAVELLSGPDPASEPHLDDGDFTLFDYRYRATGSGAVTFTGRVTGTGPGGAVTSEPSEPWTVTVTGPALTVEVTVDPAEALTGDTVTVTVDVTNDGSQAVTDVTPADPVPSSDDEGEVTKTSGPEPATVDTLAPGASTSFTYRYSADREGTVRFDASVGATGPGDVDVAGEFTCPTEGDTTCTITIASNVIVVNSTERRRLVPGSTLCDTGEEILRNGESERECTLAAAVELANGRSGADTIHFDIPAGSPVIEDYDFEVTDRVVIDGTTQPGTGRVAIHGDEYLDEGQLDSSCINAEYPASLNFGLNPVIALMAGSGGSEIRGLAISGASTAGLLVEAASSGNLVEDNLFGTDGTAGLGNGIVCPDYSRIPLHYLGGGMVVLSADNVIQGNLFSGNGSRIPVGGGLETIQGIGLRIEGPGGNQVLSNQFVGGTGLMGVQYLNLVVYGSPNNQIGAPGAGNTFSAGRHGEILVTDGAAAGNMIQGNTFTGGTPVSGGIQITSAPQTSVGGAGAGDGNQVGSTIAVIDADRARITGNFVGVAGDGSTPFGAASMYGIDLQGATNAVVSGNVVSRGALGGVRMTSGAVGNLITGNRIFGNGASGLPGSGVLVAATNSPSEQSHSNTIRGNEIYDNTGLGIDLGGDGPDPRDPGSFLGGEPAPPNRRIAAPAIDAVSDGTRTLLFGNLVTPLGGGETFFVDVYVNDLCDPSDHGEGRTPLATVEVISGVLSPTYFEALVPAPLAVGARIAATVTDAVGNTSEFSRCGEVRAGSGLSGEAAAGDGRVDVADEGMFSEGARVTICPGCPNQESNIVTGFGSLILASPLRYDHGAGEMIVVDDTSARGLKEQAKTLILPYGLHPDTEVAIRAHKAMARIDDALGRTWLDDDHLGADGKKVFDDEEKAVRDLLKLLDDLGPGAEGDVLAAIDALVLADTVLAHMAVTDAGAVCAAAEERDRDKCLTELDKAYREWDKAQDDLDRGKPDKAIAHLGKAWSHAAKAIAKAG